MELKIVKGILKKYTPGEETELVLPEGITGLGVRVFKGCGHLTSITLPDGLQEIDDYAFRDCTGLRSLHIPASVRALGEGFCRGCKALEDITLPPDLTILPDHGLQDCRALRSVTLPVAVQTIGEGAFGSCKALSELYLPDSVRRIGSAAFSGCRKLAAVRFPEELAFVGANAFSDTQWLLTQQNPLVLAGAHIVCRCHPAAESIDVPEGVHTIADSAFLGCEQLRHVTLPSTLRHIGDSAFLRCNALTEIIIPDGTERIDRHAFCACSSLAAVRIPESVCRIGYEAFHRTPWFSGQNAPFVVAGSVLLRCRVQKQPDLTVPGGIRAIGANAFEWSLSRRITLPEGIERICDSAFRASSVAEISLPQSLQIIESGAFCECQNLRSVYIPNNVRYIGDFAFAYNYDMKEISLPGKIGSVGGQAFTMGTKLRFRMPETVLSLTLRKDWSLSAGGFFQLDAGCGKNEQALLDFLASDSIAEREALFEQIREAAYRRILAVYMCRFYPDSALFRAYVKRTLRHLAEDCIAEHDAASLAALLSLEPVKAKDIDGLIEKAIRSGEPELQAILLSHKNGKDLYEDPFSLFTL